MRRDLKSKKRRNRSIKNQRNRALRPLVETLESRQLLTIVTTFPAAGTIQFDSDGDSDTLIVEATSNGGDLTYDDGGGLGSTDITGIDTIIFNGGDGDDTFLMISTINEILFDGTITFNGGSGDDTLRSASATITGGAGTHVPSGADSGALTYTTASSTFALTYTGLELINDTIQSDTFVNDTTTNAETINIIAGPSLPAVSTFQQGPVYLDNGDWDDANHGRNNAGTNEDGYKVIEDAVRFVHTNAFNASATKDVLVVGATLTPGHPQAPALGLARQAIDSAISAIPAITTVDYVEASTPAFNEYTVGATTYSFEDISGTGTPVAFTDNREEQGQFPIGFDFDFYGNTEDAVTITTEGYITFDQPRGEADETPDNNPATNRPHGTIAGWWDDLDPFDSGVGSVRYETVGTPGSQRFIVQYTNVPYDGAGGTLVTFQIKLHEATGDIDVHFQNVPGNGGSNAEVSVENLGGDFGTQFFFGTGGQPANTAVRFQPNGTFHPAVDNGLESVDFNDYKMIYVPSSAQQLDDSSGATGADIDALAARKTDIQAFVRAGGGIAAIAESPTTADSGPVGWLELPLAFTIDEFSDAEPLHLTQIAVDHGFSITQPGPGVFYHGAWTGPAGFNGLDVLVVDNGDNGTFESTVNGSGNVTAVGGDDRIIVIGQGPINDQIGGGQTVEINDGGTGNFTTLRIGAKATSLTVNSLDGGDTINVGTSADTLEILGSPLVITGGDANDTDTLSVTDEADTNDNTVVVNASLVQGLAGFDVTYSDIDALTVTSGSGNDTVALDVSTPGDLDAVTINGGAGNDIFGDAPPNAMIQPSTTVAITLDGGSPSTGDAGVPPDGDTLYLDMSAASAPVVVSTVSGVALSASHQTLNFSDFELFDVDDPSGDIIPRDMPGTGEGGDLYIRGTEAGDAVTNGNDRIILSASNGNLVRTFFNSQFQGNFGVSGTIIVRGRGGDDFMVGASTLNFPMEFHGEDGNDYMATSIQGDQMFGGEGDDILLGGFGDDTLMGEAGRDQVSGHDGDDILDGGVGNDVVNGGRGNDTLDGGDGVDSLAGEAGDDLLRGGAGDDDLNGYSGNDVLFGQDGNDRLFGEADDDVVIAGDGLDHTAGGGGADALVPGELDSMTLNVEDNSFGASLAAAWASSPMLNVRSAMLMAAGIVAGNMLDDSFADTVRGDEDGDLKFIDSLDINWQTMAEDQVVTI